MFLSIRRIVLNFNFKKLVNFKTTKHYGTGSNISVDGNGNKVDIGVNQEESTIRDIKAALADLKHNGPGVGGSKNPFKCANIEKLLYMYSSYELPTEEQESTQNYISNAAKCNADAGIPGHVQQESRRLARALEQHLERIKNQ